MHLSQWIILIVVISLILGPWAMLRPSPAQKRREQLRLFARSLGLHFGLRSLPVVIDQQPQEFQYAVYFVAPRPQDDRDDWLLFRASFEHELHLLGVWAWQGIQRASAEEVKLLNQFLAQVPVTVKAVSGGRGGYSVYWTEQGDENFVTEMAQFLRQMQKKV